MASSGVAHKAIGSSDEEEEDPRDNMAIARSTEHGPDPGDNTAIARPTEGGLDPGDHTANAVSGSQSFVSRPRRGGPARGIIVANSKYVNISTGQMVPGTVGEDTLELRLREAKKIFVKTEIYRKMNRKVKQFGHVTIIGASGEGKTTMALMLSLRYRNRGYQVVFVDSIEKFDLDSCLSSTPRVFLIIDDLFGTVGLSTNVQLIKTFLNDLMLQIDLCKQSHEQMLSVWQDGGKSSHDDKSKGPTKDIRVIFTSKSYNFHDGLAQLHSASISLFGEQTIMNITLHDVNCLSPAEKQEIYERHMSMLDECSKADLPEYNDLETDSNLFGFPLICKLASFSKNVRKLFKEPLSYLREELNDIITSKNDRSGVLVLMLLCEDRLKLTTLESEDEDQDVDTKVKHVIGLMPTATRSGMCQAARNFRGTYFTRGDTVGFAHSSIYDACACVLYNVNPSFVLKHCSEDFLYERVQQGTVQETKVDEHLHLISVSEVYHDLLTTRLAHSLKQGHFSKSVTHPILKQDKLAKQLLERLHFDGTRHDSTGNAWFHQREKGKCVLYWAVLGHNPYLVTNVENQTGEVFTQDEIREGMEGCAQTNNVTLLKWLLSRSDEHDRINRLNRLMFSAAENGSTETLLYLLKEGAKPHTCDSMMQNIFHLVCRSRHENTLQALLNVSVNKQVIDSIDINGHTPLMVAAMKGSEECFKLLTPFSNIGVQDMYGNSLIHLACHGGNISIVRHLLPSFDINKAGVKGWTLIMVAAVTGQRDVFDLLKSKEADLSLFDTTGASLLHHACQGGNMAIVQHLLSDSDINKSGLHGWTPIMVAALFGHKRVFDILESKGADLSLFDTTGDSLLHLACHGGNMAIVQHLLSDSNINQLGMVGWTPIMVAAIKGHERVCDFLESKGANLSLVDTTGDSLLHLACHGGNMAIVQRLLSDSNINQLGMEGWTPIMVAAVKGHQRVLDLLESKGADLSLVSSSGSSLLHLACQGGNKSMVQYLLSDSNINKTRMDGWTPIMVAAVSGNKSVFDLLESKGADLSLVDTSGAGLLHFACQGGNLAIVQYLLSDSNINQRGLHGWTPIMVAAFLAHKRVFDYLESKRADLSLVSPSGASLLHLACQGGNKAIVQHLLSDSNINKTKMDGWTPIMVAAASGHKNVFDLLELKGANQSLVATCGASLLHLACRGGNVAIVQHLLSDSNINKRGMNGWTPIMVAALYGHKSVFDLLVSKGAKLLLVGTYGDSVFHLACQGGNKGIILHLSRLLCHRNVDEYM
ncbi:ankyrin-3-like [Haliotis rufescens]|uniref:ankyrin-3-like n=1 Tax=Haliotis rufescens TaxID=6454 RepID=UPI00201F2014|nr:ankyrin-3-like [Haliotis rufescens]